MVHKENTSPSIYSLSVPKQKRNYEKVINLGKVGENILIPGR